MASAVILVEYLELGADHGLSGGADDQGEFESKPFLVAYGDRGDFINQVAGVVSVSGGIGGLVRRTAPYQLPDNPRLYADANSITWTPEGQLLAGTFPIQYSHAIVTVMFRQPTWNIDGNADDPGFYNSLSQDPTENQSLLYATQELSYAKEWMTIPNSSVQFMSDGKSVNASKGRSVTVTTVRITFHNFPLLPFGVFRQYADSVNNAVFLGCDVGTVMFEGPATTREATTTGQVTQKLMLTFKWRKYDWNKSLRDDGITWDFIVTKGTPVGPGPPSNTQANYTYQPFGSLLQLLSPS
jgi:hypothetical protein